MNDVNSDILLTKYEAEIERLLIENKRLKAEVESAGIVCNSYVKENLQLRSRIERLCAAVEAIEDKP